MPSPAQRFRYRRESPSADFPKENQSAARVIPDAKRKTVRIINFTIAPLTPICGATVLKCLWQLRGPHQKCN